jgi:hypothetical protein
MGLNNAFGDMLLNFVMATMFIVLPLFWVTALGWAGYSVGNLLQGLTMGTAGTRAAGSKAGNLAFSTSMKWATTPDKKK